MSIAAYPARAASLTEPKASRPELNRGTVDYVVWSRVAPSSSLAKLSFTESEAPSDYSETAPVVPATIFVIEAHIAQLCMQGMNSCREGQLSEDPEISAVWASATGLGPSFSKAAQRFRSSPLDLKVMWTLRSLLGFMEKPSSRTDFCLFQTAVEAAQRTARSTLWG